MPPICWCPHCNADMTVSYINISYWIQTKHIPNSTSTKNSYILWVLSKIRENVKEGELGEKKKGLNRWWLNYFASENLIKHMIMIELPWCLNSKLSACQCRRCRIDPWVRKIPWRRKWQLIQYACQGNPMDKGDWGATVHGVTKSWTWVSS